MPGPSQSNSKIMRRTYLLFLCFLFSAQTQSQSLDRQVIGSAGLAVQSSTTGLSFTVGEAVTESAVTSSVVLTQGFQQVDDDELIGIFEPLPEGISLLIYPNPTSKYLTIRCNLYQNGIDELSYTIIDMHGRKVMVGVIPSGIAQLDVTNLASSSYTILFRSGDGRYMKQERFIKAI